MSGAGADSLGAPAAASQDPLVAPSGGSEEPLASVVDRLDGDGATFEVQPGGRLRCQVCGRSHDAGDMEVRATRRLEGASDPADMSMVHELRCPTCGSVGALVTRYGPEASPDEGDVLVALPRGDDRGATAG